MNSDENPYFDASVARPVAAAHCASNAATLLEVPAATERPQTPTTPVLEQPPGRAPPASLARTVPFRPLGDRQQSSIRLRRCPDDAGPPPRLDTIPSAGELEEPAQQQQQQQSDNGLLRPLSRFRSGSGSRSRAGSNALPLSRLPTIEDDVVQNLQSSGAEPAQSRPQFAAPGWTRNEGRAPTGTVAPGQGDRRGSRAEYHSNLVDFLDVIGEKPELH
jgi:hypothetical protein